MRGKDIMSENKTLGEKIFNIVNVAILLLLTLIFAYPIWYCLVASFSDPGRLLMYRGVLLKPLGFTLIGYKTVLSNPNVLVGYANTLFYVGVGTILGMLFTILGAYGLSRRNLMLKRPLMLLVVITMYVDCGLIPNFLLIRQLGLYDSRWAVIFATLITTYNMIVMRTAFSQIPRSLEESAMLDGANDFVILWRIILPVSKATIAVVALFIACGRWNAWFNASIFLRDREKYPLQLFLREILIANSTTANEGTSEDGIYFLEAIIKYCTIIVATIPILCVYPFVQKYFVTGVMLGSVKG